MSGRKISALLTVWIGCLAVGLGLQQAYEWTPAATVSAAATWPTRSPWKLAADRPTAVMFVHPRCPCSRASLGELQALALECGDRVAIRIIFVDETSTAESPLEECELWKTAHGVAAEVLVCVPEEAALFGATASGETLLYDVDGRLLFQGGITAARGQAGNNPGRAALTSLVTHPIPERIKTPVFGCALTNSCCLRKEYADSCKP